MNSNKKVLMKASLSSEDYHDFSYSTAASSLSSASLSTPKKSSQYTQNPNHQFIKILEPKEVDLVANQNFFKLIDFIFPENFHFYESDSSRSREYYEAILVGSESIEIKHYYDKQDPSRINYSNVTILQVLTLSDWQQRPYSMKTLEGYPLKIMYNYYDYQEAWYKTFYLRNYNHSWFIYFSNNFSGNYPNWFLEWFKYFGIIPEILPPAVQQSFDLFKKYFPQEGEIPFERLLQFAATFTIPWILAWTYYFAPATTTDSQFPNSQFPILYRDYRVKWWDSFSMVKANVRAISKYCSAKTPPIPTSSSQNSPIEFSINQKILMTMLASTKCEAEIADIIHHATFFK